jgi:hypothetical protein
MSEAVQVALIVATPGVLIGTAQLVLAIKNSAKVTDLHLAVNSRLDQLVTATRESAHAAGVLEGQKKEDSL